MSLYRFLGSRWVKLCAVVFASLMLIALFLWLQSRNAALANRLEEFAAANREFAEQNEVLTGEQRDFDKEVERRFALKRDEMLIAARDAGKEMVKPFALEVARLSKEQELQADLHRSTTGFEVVERDDFVLYYPPALRWLLSKPDAIRITETAHRAVSERLGKFQRKVKVRLVTGTTVQGEGTLTLGRFQRDGDEILVWPHGLSNETLVHEFTHAWVYQRFEGKYPAALDEGLCYTMERREPEKMFQWLEPAGPTSKAALLAVIPSNGKERYSVQASAWLVFYYLSCIQELEPKEILRKEPKDLPDPKAIVDVVWAHSQLLAPKNYVVVSGPFSDPWLDLAELGPLTLPELKSFNRSDKAQLRKLEATRELLALDLRLRGAEYPKSYSSLSKIPDIEAIWKARRREVFHEMCRAGDSSCLSFQYGVSLSRLARAACEPLVGPADFPAASVGLSLRKRCEATVWARSYVTTVCEGEPLFTGVCSKPPSFDAVKLRKIVIEEALRRLGKELRLRPMNVFKLR